MVEHRPLPFIVKNNKSFISLRNDYGEVLPFQCGIYATSGHGKGLFTEAIVQQWRESTKGIVLCIADPKDEAEFSFANYPAKERYHTEQLMRDGAKPKGYPVKLYHPFTFNIPSGYLPDINFFTLSLKDMKREEWSILAESSWDSETIRLLLRVADSLPRSKGLLYFMHEIDKLTGARDKKKRTKDPHNYYLSVGGGTAKSMVEISGLMDTFLKDNYFIRKDNCPHKLDWKSILTDNQNYHVFLSMWLTDDKLKEFMVLSLIKRVIANRKYLKRPVLIVIPEILKLCPRNAQGYKLFLSSAISESLVTMRSMAKGMSCVYDSQDYSNTDDKIRGGTMITFFGQMSAKDQEVVAKIMSYKRDYKEQLQNMKVNGYFKAGFEDEDVVRGFFPRHSHKEPKYNWLEMYHENNPNKEKMYNELITEMRSELDAEKKEIRDRFLKEMEREREERAKREEKKKEVEDKSSVKKVNQKKELLMKLCWDMYNNEELPKKDRSFRKIGDKYNLHNTTAKRYVEEYRKKLDDEQNLQS